MKKILITMLLGAILLIVAGCSKIVYSDVTINADLTGTWKVKIFSTEPIPKDAIEDTLKKKEIESYSMMPIKEDLDLFGNGQTKTMDGWEITMPWKSPEELKKVVEFLKAGQMTTKDKNSIEPFTKDEAGMVSVNFGNIPFNKLTFHVDGTLNQANSMTQGKILNPKTIEFTSNQTIAFQFKPAEPVKFDKALLGAAAASGILAAGGGFIYYRKRKVKIDKNKDQEISQ